MDEMFLDTSIDASITLFDMVGNISQPCRKNTSITICQQIPQLKQTKQQFTSEVTTGAFDQPVTSIVGLVVLELYVCCIKARERHLAQGHSLTPVTKVTCDYQSSQLLLVSGAAPGRQAKEHGLVGQPGAEVHVHAAVGRQVVQRQFRAVPTRRSGEGGEGESAEGPGRAGREGPAAPRAGQTAVRHFLHETSRASSPKIISLPCKQ